MSHFSPNFTIHSPFIFSTISLSVSLLLGYCWDVGSMLFLLLDRLHNIDDCLDSDEYGYRERRMRNQLC